MSCELWVVGTPLDEERALEPFALELLKSVDLIVGERRKPTFRWLKGLPSPEVHLMDPPREDTWELLRTRLREIAHSGGRVALLSDAGMPILWDPGVHVLEECRKLGFEVRSFPAATSWGTACALSGFPPPFLLLGFPPRKMEERRGYFTDAARNAAHCVFMDTPYRFELLLQETVRAFGPSRDAFLAWEISKPGEWLHWGPLGGLPKAAEARNARKGEFILILRGKK